MEAHRGVDPEFNQGRDQWAARRELSDAGLGVQAEPRLEESGVVVPEQPSSHAVRAARHAADAGPQVAQHTSRSGLPRWGVAMKIRRRTSGRRRR